MARNSSTNAISVLSNTKAWDRKLQTFQQSSQTIFPTVYFQTVFSNVVFSDIVCQTVHISTFRLSSHILASCTGIAFSGLSLQKHCKNVKLISINFFLPTVEATSAFGRRWPFQSTTLQLWDLLLRFCWNRRR